MAGADLSLIAMEFGISWGYSALVTLLVGGLFWWPLHAYGYDNVVSYILISAICYTVMTILANGGTTWSLLAFAMILANAVGVRIVERVLRTSRTT